MTDHNHAVRDDIAFLRALAEDGRDGPVVGGAILVLVGGVYAAASLFTAYSINSGLARQPLFFPAVWFGASVIATVILMLMKLRQPAKAGASRAAGLAWAAAGWTIGAIIVSLMVIGLHTGNWSVMEAIPSLVMAIYGGAWMIAARVSGQRWITGAAAAFVMGAVIGYFVDRPPCS